MNCIEQGIAAILFAIVFLLADKLPPIPKFKLNLYPLEWKVKMTEPNSGFMEKIIAGIFFVVGIFLILLGVLA